MKKTSKLLSLLLILVLIYLQLPTCKVKAQTISEMSSGEIVFNEFDSITVKSNELTVYKINMTTDGSFKLDFSPKAIHSLVMALYTEQGVLINKSDCSFLDTYELSSRSFADNLSSGIYYLSVYTAGTDNDGEFSYYGSLTPAKTSSLAITLEIKQNKSFQLNTDITGTTDKKIIWKSSNDKIATVSSLGKVKGIKKGTATIKAYTKSGLVSKIKVKVIK